MSEGWLAICLLLMGSGFLFFSVGIWRVNKLVQPWPKASIEILNQRIERSTSGRSGFRPYIEYAFLVNGVRYQSNKVYKVFLENTSSVKAQAKLEELLSRSEVKYNPANPNDCCLTIIKFGWLQWLLLILGSVFFLFGLLSGLALIVNGLS